MPYLKTLLSTTIFFVCSVVVFAQKDLKIIYKNNPNTQEITLENVLFDQHQKLFKQFEYLSTIKLYHAPPQLPQSLFLTPLLQNLHIYDTKSFTTDSNFRFASRLQWLSFNMVNVQLDTHFYRLRKLKTLHFIEGSCDWNLPKKETLPFPQLEELAFYGIQLDTFNLKHKVLEQLHTLVLKKCNLKVLDSIKGLKNIKYLVLDSNKLHNFPPEILSLKTLRVLSLKGNYLNQIPEEIFRLRNLEVLNLTGNTISPTALLELKALLPRTEIIYVRND